MNALDRPVLEAVDLLLDRSPGPYVNVPKLEADPGDVVAICGPNGAGKSTLLRLLAGDIRPSSGHVLLGGDDIAKLPKSEMARRRSVMTQDWNVAFPFTVREVVEMGRAPWGRTEAGPVVVDRAMATTEVDHLANRSVTSLSGGERARTALARVVAQDCKILLLDEPTAALDLHHQELLVTLLTELAASGHTSIVVLHDLALAAAVATRVVLMRDGEVVSDGPPAEVIRSAPLSDAYRHPIDVLHHEQVPTPIVVPRRDTGNSNTHSPGPSAHQPGPSAHQQGATQTS